MIQLSQRCHYAIRAVLELARRGPGFSATIGEIAEAQAIPAGFLAVILGELRRAGIVQSRRGSRGGYSLVAAASEVFLADVMAAVEGPGWRTDGLHMMNRQGEYVWGDSALAELYSHAADCVGEIFAKTSCAEVIEREAANAPALAGNYSI